MTCGSTGLFTSTPGDREIHRNSLKGCDPANLIHAGNDFPKHRIGSLVVRTVTQGKKNSQLASPASPYPPMQTQPGWESRGVIYQDVM